MKVSRTLAENYMVIDSVCRCDVFDYLFFTVFQLDSQLTIVFFLLKRKQNWEKTKQNKARMRLDEGREIFAHTKQTKRTHTHKFARERERENLEICSISSSRSICMKTNYFAISIRLICSFHFGNSLQFFLGAINSRVCTINNVDLWLSILFLHLIWISN